MSFSIPLPEEMHYYPYFCKWCNNRLADLDYAPPTYARNVTGVRLCPECDMWPNLTDDNDVSTDPRCIGALLFYDTLLKAFRRYRGLSE